MKKFFLLLVGSIFSIIPMLGQVEIVTISHDNEITAFYGRNAFIEAYNSAQNGDIITLSSGIFSATDIDKSIIISGAGMDDDASKNHQRTILNGDFSLKNSSEESHEITIEGIYNNGKIKLEGNINNIQFTKCRLKQFSIGSDRYWANVSFMNCRIASSCGFYSPKSKVFFINSIVFHPINYFNGTHGGPFYFANCIIEQDPYYIEKSTFNNCIFIFYYEVSKTSTLSDSNIANNCVGTGTDHNIWDQVNNGNNCMAENLFKTFDGTYSDSENFELTDDAKTMYRGRDGKEVGIYGGLSFDPTPTNPQITKFDVAPKSTPDGKLLIDIVVE